MNRNVLRRVAGGVLVIALAAILSLAGCWTLVSPWAFRHLHVSIIWALNIIPATAGVIIGRGSPDHFLAAALKPCDFCGPADHLANYLGLAIPAYIAAFVIVAVVARLLRRRRGNVAGA